MEILDHKAASQSPFGFQNCSYVHHPTVDSMISLVRVLLSFLPEYFLRSSVTLVLLLPCLCMSVYSLMLFSSGVLVFTSIHVL